MKRLLVPENDSAIFCSAVFDDLAGFLLGSSAVV